MPAAPHQKGRAKDSRQMSKNDKRTFDGDFLTGIIIPVG
jgi:hypothetical protein